MTPQDNAKSRAKAKKTGDDVKLPLMKNPFLYIGTIVVLGISVAAFIWVPAGKQSGYGSRIVFGSYAGKSIDYKQGNYLARMANYFNQQQQNDSTSENVYFQAYQVWRQAFERTVIHFGLLYEADKAGLAVSEDRLNKEVMALSQYQENGKFSLRLYKAQSDSAKAVARDETKENLIVQSYLEGYQDVKPSKNESAYIKALNSPMRAFSFVTFPFSSFPDSEIQAYASKNSDLFRMMKVSYIKAAKSKSLAASLLKEISGGTTKFADALNGAEAKGYSGIEGIERAYWEIKDYFSDEKDAQAVIGLAKGAFSPVYKTKDGEYIFFLCEEAAVAPDVSSQEQRSKIWNYISSREKGVIEEYSRKQAQAFVTSAAGGFDAAVKQYGLTTKKLAGFPLNYGSMPLIKQADTSQFPELAGIGTNEEFLTAAFSLKKGELSKPLAVTEAVVVLRFDEESQATEADTAVIDYYYSYYLSQYMDGEISNHFLKSPLFKDEFGAAFQKYIAPKSE
jgi:parvulin-like peptidyl-prolyl isomerase